MRPVAVFAFSTLDEVAARTAERFAVVVEKIDEWLLAKGDVAPSGSTVKYRDGRQAALARQTVKSLLGQAFSLTLTEPTTGGRFMTELSVGRTADELAFCCVLSAGAPGSVLTPSYVETRCPQIVRSVIDLGFGWRVGGTLVRTTPLTYRTYAEAASLVTELMRPERSLPVVVVSEHYGLTLHPRLSEALAQDLAGVALVAQLSDDASWTMTHNLGKEWSCYNGAIRLFWPFGEERGDATRHPYWTSQRLLQDVSNTEEAASRVRALLRRRLFGLASFAVEPSRLFDTIRHAAVAEELSQRRAMADRRAELQDLADLYADDNDSLRKALTEKQAELHELVALYADENQTLRRELDAERGLTRQLRRDVYDLQARLVWRDGEGDLQPSFEDAPRTLEAAVERARRGFPQFLTFGDDVPAGVATLAPEAGPPEKVFEYLQALADMVPLRRDGALGKGMVQWLADRGICASGESETIQNNRQEMAKRRWHDGREHREFHLHLKPNDATAPDKCVRIYFEWDEPTAMVVVGWVGRHP